MENKKIEDRKANNIPAADETGKRTSGCKPDFFTGLSSGDKSFVGAIFSIVLLYFVKRFFDSSDKAIDKGYDVTFSADNYGNLKFTKGSDSQSGVDPEAAEADEGQNAEEESSGEESNGESSAREGNES